MDQETQTTSTPSSGGGKFNPMLLVGIVIVVVVAGAIWIGSNKSQNKSATPAPTQMNMHMSATTAPSPTTQPAATGVQGAMTTGTQTTGKVENITVEGGNYYFNPKQITVKKGDTVNITFKNAGGFHDFVLDEFNVKTSVIKSDATATVSFVADKAGTFQYYCSVGNHRAMGMEGTLTVE